MAEHTTLSASNPDGAGWADTLTLEKLHNLLFTAVESADIDMLKADVLPFIKDPRELELWSKDFFREIVPLFSGVEKDK